MKRKRTPKGALPSLTYRDLIKPGVEAEIVERTDARFRLLTYTPYPPVPFDPDLFAKDLTAMNGRASIFPDSNIFLALTYLPIWDALFSCKRLFVTAGIEAEIEPWLNDPRSINVAIHQRIMHSIKAKDGAINGFEVPAIKTDLSYAVRWYARLLGSRKSLRNIVKNDATEQGLVMTNEEINDRVKKRFGERGLRLSLSGDACKEPSHLLIDEDLVMHAILHALGLGRNTVILTSDENVYEQFRKATWLLDTHYRSMLMAEWHFQDPGVFGEPVRVSGLTENEKTALSLAFATDDYILLKTPSTRLRELLPVGQTVIKIQCCLIREKLEVLAFTVPMDMGLLFRIKGQTKGLSTNRFGERNCHAWLGPIAPVVGEYAAIGRDNFTTSSQFSYSMLDVNIVLHDREGKFLVATKEELEVLRSAY